MNFEEHAAKDLLANAGIAVPRGRLCRTPDEAAAAADALSPCVVKAQVPVGKRGKAGGIRPADGAAAARAAAEAILGMTIGGHRVERLLVEERAAIARELYAAVLNDPASRGPLILVGAEGGMDIEDLAETRPETLLRLAVDIGAGPDRRRLREGLARLGLGAAVDEFVARLYDLYLECDAELLEVNPLALTAAGALIALDAKLALDDSAAPRQAELAARASPETLSELEARARDLGLKFIELDGTVGILANGAGLTMTTMDAVRHYGGRPANFLEIGGEAYTQGRPALELVLANPNVTSLLVNFCGAFARTDVMTEGILEAWAALEPKVPVFFTIHGTGEDEAQAMVRARLGLEPYDVMDEAVRAAVEAAR